MKQILIAVLFLFAGSEAMGQCTVSIAASGSTVLCPGGNVVLSAVTNVVSNASYQWIVNGNVVAGAQSATYTANTPGSYTVTVTNNTTGCTITSAALIITMSNLSVIITPPNPVICAGDTVALTANVTPNNVIAYQWRFNNLALLNGNMSTFRASVAGSYLVDVSYGSCTVTAAAVVVSVNPLPTVAITPTPASATVCSGDSVLLTGATGSAITYQWLRGGVPIAGYTSSTFKTAIAGVYSYTSNNSAGCSNTSAPVTVTVNARPAAAIIATPSSATICLGDTVVLVPSTLSVPALTYQWLQGSAPVPAQSLSLHTGTPGTYYYIVTSVANGCSNTSAPVTVTVNNPPAPAVLSSNAPVCVGDTLKLFATSPVPGVTYNWTGVNGFTSSLQNPTLANANSAMVGDYWLSTSLNGCTSSLYSTPVMLSCLDSLWPGDANYDLVVDNNDILHIALGYGFAGYTRANASINWTAQFCHDWASTIGTINMKHADCDGDGLISLNDTNAVSVNYSLTHQKHVHQPQARGAGVPDLYFDLTGIAMTPGTNVSIPIKLGSSAQPMNHITGIAASIKIAGVTMTGNSALTYPSSWLGTAANTIRFTKAFSTNQTDWTYVRTDHHTISGQGTIANLQLHIPASAGGQQLQLYFEDVRMVDSAGMVLSGYNVIDDSVSIQPTGVATTNSLIESMILSPNPAHNYCSLQINMKQETSAQLQVTDLVGRVVWQSAVQLKNGSQRIELPAATFLPGIYFVRLQTSTAPGVQALRWVKE